VDNVRPRKIKNSKLRMLPTPVKRNEILGSKSPLLKYAGVHRDCQKKGTRGPRALAVISCTYEEIRMRGIRCWTRRRVFQLTPGVFCPLPATAWVVQAPIWNERVEFSLFRVVISGQRSDESALPRQLRIPMCRSSLPMYRRSDSFLCRACRFPRLFRGRLPSRRPRLQRRVP